jgi:hypothetical protein
MRFFKYSIGLALPVLIWQIATARPQRMSYSDTKKTIERIKDESDRFKNNFNDDVRRSGVDSHTRREMKRTVDRFEDAAEHLKDRYHKDNAAVPSVREVLAQAVLIDSFVSQHIVSPRVRDQWLLLRQDLDLLAGSYNLTSEFPPSALARTEYPAPAAVVVIPVQPGSRQIQGLLQDLQTDAAAFQAAVRSSLANLPAGEMETGSSINQYVGDFMVSADRFQSTYTTEDANEILTRGGAIDQYMQDHPLSVSAQQSWIRLRNDLVRLAAAYNISPAWLSR